MTDNLTIPPLFYVSFDRTIRQEVQLPGYEEFGTEPNLIEMVRRYYQAGMCGATPAEIETLVQQYFETLARA